MSESSVSSLVKVGGFVSVRSLLGRSGSFDVARFESDEDRIREIISTICKRARNEYRVLIDTWDFERCLQSVGIHDVEGLARFNKRVFKWFSDNISGYKLPSDLGGIIGGVHKDVIASPATRLFWSFGSVWDFQEDVDNGGYGFGNSNSCWLRYGCASGSPYVLDNAGGCGFYLWRDDEDGKRISCGRLWVVNDSDGRLAVFNPYLDLGSRGGSSSSYDNLSILLSVLVSALGGSAFDFSNFNFKIGDSGFRFEAFYAYGSTDTIYINDSEVYVLGSVGNRIDFNNPFDYGVVCANCGDRISDDDSYRGADGEYYCESCFNNLFTICERCEDTIRRRDAFQGSDDCLYCESCFDELFIACEACGSVVSMDDAYEGSDGCLYCEDCFNRRFAVCEACGSVVSMDDAYGGSDGCLYCESCFNERFFYCEACGSVVSMDDAYGGSDGCLYCEVIALLGSCSD